MNSSSRIIASVVILSSIVIGAVFILNISNSPLISDTDISFVEIDKGFYNGVTARLNYTISDLESWEYLWNDMHSICSSIPELPSVNFTTDLIFAVFQGERATGGYITTITRIVYMTNGYVVYVDEMHPGPSCGVTQAFTQPYHIVKISGFPQYLHAQFVYNITVVDCGT